MATTIRQTLFYQQLFSGSVFVVKISGKMFGRTTLRRVLKDLALIHKSGIKVILVHGCGSQIDAELEKIGEEIKKDNGMRVTSDRAMDVVVRIAQEIKNKIIVQLKKERCNAQGNFERRVIAHRISQNNCTGEITRIKKLALAKFLKKGIVVIPPLAVDKGGNFLNINADSMAFALAASFRADKLIFMTDVFGIYGREKKLILQVTSKEAKELIEKSVITGGMIPKVLSCIKALSKGVSRITILSGFEPCALLREVFTKRGCGTMIIR